MATQDGCRRIDEIEVGDLVWAHNVETGELELKEVLTVYVKENREILHLETSIGNIDTTTNHPFYVIGEGWVAAGDLIVGDEVYTLDGSVSVITGYWHEVFDAPVMVYNLEVEGFHTYFVGEFGVLVHNLYYMTPREMNNARDRVLGNEDVNFKTKQDALNFIDKKFSNFVQESAGNRSAEGWHFDNHSIVEGGDSIEHINIYSKDQGFRVHLTWGNNWVPLKTPPNIKHRKL